jgi:hypothetical protein
LCKFEGAVGPVAGRSASWGDIVSVDKSSAGVESTGDSRTKVFYNYDFPVPKTSRNHPASSIVVMRGNLGASTGASTGKGENNSGSSSSSGKYSTANVHAATAVGDRNVVLTHWLNPNSKDHLNGLTRSLHADFFQNSSLNSDLYIKFENYLVQIKIINRCLLLGTQTRNKRNLLLENVNNKQFAVCIYINFEIIISFKGIEL